MPLPKVSISRPLPKREEVDNAVDVLNALADLRIVVKNGQSSASGALSMSPTGSVLTVDISRIAQISTIETLEYASTIDIDFASMSGRTFLVTLTNTLTLTMSNYTPGARVEMLFTGAGSYSINTPAGLRHPINTGSASAGEHDNGVTTTQNMHMDFICTGYDIASVFMKYA